MKTEYLQAFLPAVAKKVKNAESMGSKTTWTTNDHLSALADIIASKVGSSSAPVLDVLKECYNVSAFQQTLAKVPAYKAAGHFQREGKQGLSDILATLEANAKG